MPRVFFYYDGPSPVPKPGEPVTLTDGRTGVVDTAHGSEGTIEKRKLAVLLDSQDSSCSEN